MRQLADTGAEIVALRLVVEGFSAQGCGVLEAGGHGVDGEDLRGLMECGGGGEGAEADGPAADYGDSAVVYLGAGYVREGVAGGKELGAVSSS